MDEAEIDDWLIEDILDLLNDASAGRVPRGTFSDQYTRVSLMGFMRTSDDARQYRRTGIQEGTG